MRKRFPFHALLLMLLCGAVAPAPAAARPSPGLGKAIAALDAHRFLADVQQLSSDDFEGRSPGTEGEERTVGWLEEQFRALGLEPGNPDGSYVQRVPMTAFQARPEASFSVRGQSLALSFPEDFVAFTPVREGHVSLRDSPLVFVGYGIQAPEYGWDDYKGMDVRGKTLLMLINDPPIPDRAHPGQLDPAVFGGKAMTYYGRWTYKYEIARKLGAAAAIIIHEEVPAAYPWSVVVNSWKGENFVIHDGSPVVEYPAISSWISLDSCKSLLAASGLNLGQLKKAALSRGFRPIDLPATVNFEIENTWRDVESRNVVALLPGADPRHGEETVVYSAHWDHFGRDPHLPGDKHDQIFHGALDNGTGTAALLELARAFRALPAPPRRSVLFLATTAEERGLLGALYYARHPLRPIDRTVADLNMDGIAVYGATRDVELVSSGKSTLDELVRAQARHMGLRVVNDSHPERGGFFRADHLEFARVGVPVAYLGGGREVIGKPRGYGERRRNEFIAHDYHQVTDVVKPYWDLSGARQEMELLLRIGYRLAEGAPAPRWLPSAEFRAARPAGLSAGGQR